MKNTEMNVSHMEEMASLLKGMAHPVRLCIIKKLKMEEKCNVSEFVDCIGVSQSSISQHLIKMRDLGLLQSEKEGQNVFYYINNDDVKNIIDAIL